MTGALERRCAACSVPLPHKPGRKLSKWTQHHRYCEACIEKIRDGSLPLTCIECHVAKRVQGNFRRAPTSRTGYTYVCNDCLRRAEDEGRQLRRQQEEQDRKRREAWQAARARRATLRLRDARRNSCPNCYAVE